MSGAGPIAGSLAAISAAWGLLTWWVFRRLANLDALRAAGKRLYAHLLEIRLYSEEPALVWRAQRALIFDNVRLLGAVSKPVVLLAVVFAATYSRLDAVYGSKPIPVGETAVVMLHVGHEPESSDSGAAAYTLAAPKEIAIETSSIRDYAEREIIWRVRALAPVHAMLHIAGPGGLDLSRSISAGDDSLAYNPRRDFVGGSLRGSSDVWMEVDYPAAGFGWGGMRFSWIVWFVTLSTVVAGMAAVAGAKGRRMRKIVTQETQERPKQN